MTAEVLQTKTGWSTRGATPKEKRLDRTKAIRPGGLFLFDDIIFMVYCIFASTHGPQEGGLVLSDIEVENLVREQWQLVKAVRREFWVDRHVDQDSLMSAGYEALWEAAKRCTNAESFPTYAKSRIRWRMLDVLRRTPPNRHDTPLESEDDEGHVRRMQFVDPAHAFPLRALAGSEGRHFIAQILARLSASEREFVVLHYFHGMTLEEVGERMGLAGRPQGTRKSLMYRLRAKAVQRMREFLSPATTTPEEA